MEYFNHFSNRTAGRILCFVGGYVDTAGFVLLLSVFTASITGNIVKIAQIGAKPVHIGCYVTITITYGLGSGFIKLLSIYLRSKKDVDSSLIGITILSIEVVFLILSMIIGSYQIDDIESSGNMNTFAVISTGILMSFSMGSQAGAAANVFTTFPNTTGMTASVAQTFATGFNFFTALLRYYEWISFYLSYDELQQISDNVGYEIENLYFGDSIMKDATSANQDIVIRLQKAEKEFLQDKLFVAWDEFNKQIWPLISFSLGAFAATIAASHYKFWSLILPEFIVLILIFELVCERDIILNKRKRSLTMSSSIMSLLSMSSTSTKRIYSRDAYGGSYDSIQDNNPKEDQFSLDTDISSFRSNTPVENTRDESSRPQEVHQHHHHQTHQSNSKKARARRKLNIIKLNKDLRRIKHMKNSFYFNTEEIKNKVFFDFDKAHPEYEI